MQHVIIGASAAGISAAKKLRKFKPEDEIVMISTDDRTYSRCMLHHIISGHRNAKELNFVADTFFAENSIDWLKGTTVKAIDTKVKQLTLEDNRTVSYDTLLIATGAISNFPPIPNIKTAKNVFALRELQDAVAIAEKTQGVTDAVVIGGGLIGVDAAVGLHDRGIRVSIVEMGEHILPLQLDQRSAERYEIVFKQNGIDIFTKSTVQEILVDSNRCFIGARLSDGQIIRAGLAVVAAGVRPNTDWINDPAIKLNRGITINECCRTTADAVYAAGDVTGRSGIWPLAVKQGEVAAANMAGNQKVLEDYFNLKNSMNFFALKTVSLGLCELPDASYDEYIAETADVYKKIIYKDGIIYGAIFQGDISTSGFWAKVIAEKLSIDKASTKNLFDINYSDFYKINEQGQFYF